MRLSRSVLLLSAILILNLAIVAQTPTTSVRGTVLDPKGGVIPGATVSCRIPACP